MNEVSDGRHNTYADPERAASYATLEYPGTYGIAFRELGPLLRRYGGGRRALDFGCGTGRSTRFLKDLGFEACGVDISEAMLAEAKRRDPGGDYQLASRHGAPVLAANEYDLILAAFTFDNVAMEIKPVLFAALKKALGPMGRLIVTVSSPAIYWHEWVSFSTAHFPENRDARDGEPVRITMLDVPDRRPVVDILCSDATYRSLYAAAGLEVLEMLQPLGLATDPGPWKSELTVAPWTIYVLSK